jgi:hypothetical protein
MTSRRSVVGPTPWRPSPWPALPSPHEPRTALYKLKPLCSPRCALRRSARVGSATSPSRPHLPASADPRNELIAHKRKLLEANREREAASA